MAEGRGLDLSADVSTWQAVTAGQLRACPRSLFAYERAADRALVVAAGLASEWLTGAGVHVSKMPTLHGSLSFSLRSSDRYANLAPAAALR